MTGGSSASPDDDPLGPVVESFLARLRRGERPPLTELVARHPELASQIREMIPALVELEQLGAGGDLVPSSKNGTGSRKFGDDGPAPERLGDYMILGRIGAGGMGVVYEAEHESLKSRVALKVMHPRFRADPKYLQRFHAEARLAAGLHHTNIVGVFDFGEQDGVCYYAMQFIRGQPLNHVLADIHRLRDERTNADGLLGSDANLTIAAADASIAPSATVKGLLTAHFAGAGTDPAGGCDPVRSARPGIVAEATGPAEPVAAEPSSSLGSSSLGGSGELRYYREIARAGAQVAEALDYAHRRGVLHRDIKPSNLLLDALGNVWVTDFGLAKLEEGADPTQSRELVGTLRYMAPERFRRTSDRRGDIYSLGATLYELLALRPPFEESDEFRLIERIRNDPPPPPRELDRKIPRDLETIVLKALAKDPKDRFQSAGELAQELRRFVEGRTIRSRPVSLVERFWRWCKRDPWLAGANIAAALLTTVLAVVATAAAIVYRSQAEALRVERGRSEIAAFNAYTAQARAGRFSRRTGQRFESIEAVSQASKLLDGLPPGPDSESRRESLRELAIAALTLPDLEATGRVIRRPRDVIMTAFDPTMTRYALRFRDGAISVRRVADQREVAHLSARGDRDIYVFGFSPDGRYLATTHYPGFALTVWDLDRGVVALNDPGPVDGGAARFSPDSRRFALINGSRMLLVYDLATGRPGVTWSIPGPGNLAFRPDGAQIAVVDNDSKPATCRIFEAVTGRPVRTLSLRDTAHDVAWSPDGTTIATPGDDQKIDLWDAATGTPRATLEGHTSGGLGAAFHPAGTLLASNGWEGQLRLWDPVLARQWLTLTGVTGHDFSRDGRIVVGHEDRLTEYRVDPALEYRTFAHVSRDKLNYAQPSVRHDGRVLAVGTNRGAVLWDLARGTELGFLPMDYAWHLMFEASGDLITSGSEGVHRWPIRLDAGGGEFRIGPPHELRLPEGLCGIAEDRSGRIVAKANHTFAFAATPEGTSRISRLNDCRSVAVSPDGQWLATGTHSESRGAQVWRIRDFAKVADLPVDYGTGVDFSPDGKWLMTKESPCQLWEVGTWRPVRQIGGGAQCFSPDGRLMVVADASKALRLVETDTGRLLARFESPDTHSPRGAIFSPDGSRLVVTTNDGPAVHIWDLRAIRKHLAGVGLDWDAPAYSDHDPADPSSPPLPPLRVDLGPFAEYSQHFIEPADVLLQRYSARLEKEPDDADAYHHRAIALIHLLRLPEAIDDVTRAIRLRPDDPHYRVVRAMIYRQQRQFEPAIADFETALALEPDQYLVRESLALCCFLVDRELVKGPQPRRKLQRALALGRRAVDLVPDEAMYLNMLGVILYRAGQYDEAIGYLERSLKAGRGQADALDLFFLAMAHHRLGHRAEARTHLERGVRWLREQRHLSPLSTQQLASLPAEAEAVLAGPAGELPEDAFAPAP